MALIYGDQAAPDRFNRVGFTTDFIGAFLKQAGFSTARGACPPSASSTT